MIITIYTNVCNILGEYNGGERWNTYRIFLKSKPNSIKQCHNNAHSSSEDICLTSIVYVWP